MLAVPCVLLQFRVLPGVSQSIRNPAKSKHIDFSISKTRKYSDEVRSARAEGFSVLGLGLRV